MTLANGWEVGTQVAAVGSIMAEAPDIHRPTSVRPRVLLGLCLFGAAAALGASQWVKGLGSAAPAGLAALGSAAEQAEWIQHNALALAAHGRGDFTDAVAHQRRAAVAALRAPGPGHPDTVWTRYNLGRCYLALAAREPSALPLAAREYAAATRGFLAAGLLADACGAGISRGEALLRAGDAEAARDVLATAWERARHGPVLDQRPDMTDSAAYWLLAALRQLKRPAEAEIVADAHLQVCERRATADPAAADAQVCLRWEERAGARISQGHWDEAIALAGRAVSARQRQLAVLAPAGGAAAATAARTAVAEAQFVLGRALRGAGQYAAAERPLREALLNRFQTLGADHAKVAEAAVALMSNYCFLGRFAEARPLAEQALAVEAKLYPRADDSRRADTYHRAADVLARTGAADRAEALYRQAVTLLLARPRQPEDRYLTHACDALGRFLYGQGRRPEAILVYRRELEIERRLGCEDDREREGLSTVCNNLGRALLEENRLAEADTALSESLRVTETIPGGRAHPDATAVLSNLALLRAEQGRYAESETLFQEAFDGRVRAFGFQHPKVAYTLQGMARLYELTGRAAQAQEADARARTILASVR